MEKIFINTTSIMASQFMEESKLNELENSTLIMSWGLGEENPYLENMGKDFMIQMKKERKLSSTVEDTYDKAVEFINETLDSIEDQLEIEKYNYLKEVQINKGANIKQLVEIVKENLESDINEVLLMDGINFFSQITIEDIVVKYLSTIVKKDNFILYFKGLVENNPENYVSYKNFNTQESYNHLTITNRDEIKKVFFTFNKDESTTFRDLKQSEKQLEIFRKLESKGFKVIIFNISPVLLNLTYSTIEDLEDHIEKSKKYEAKLEKERQEQAYFDELDRVDEDLRLHFEEELEDDVYERIHNTHIQCGDYGCIDAGGAFITEISQEEFDEVKEEILQEDILNGKTPLETFHGICGGMAWGYEADMLDLDDIEGGSYGE